MKVQFGSFGPEVNSESASLEAFSGQKRPANVNEHGEMLYRVKPNPDARMLYYCPASDR
jgi:hypothetical protein